VLPERSWFQGSFKKDRPESSTQTVELPDISGEVFQLILDVLYQEKFPVLDTVEDYRSFSQYLDYLGIKVEESLITLTRFPTELIMQIVDLETVTSMGSEFDLRSLPVQVDRRENGRSPLRAAGKSRGDHQSF